MHGNSYAVILNEVKNPKACKTVVGSANLEILRYAQDDIKKNLGRVPKYRPEESSLKRVAMTPPYTKQLLVAAVVHLKA